jgi:voltage-gated potassium channel
MIMAKIFYLLIVYAVIVFIGSVMIFTIESDHPDSEINSMLDAVWWTVSTVTTVGYGDIELVTDFGKIMAIVYMFFGITFLSIFIAVFGTRVYKRRFEIEDNEISYAQKQILQKIKDLEKNQINLEKNIKDALDNLKQKE